jgi:hypothetical protein
MESQRDKNGSRQHNAAKIKGRNRFSRDAILSPVNAANYLMKILTNR